jgi:hypothetical protein
LFSSLFMKSSFPARSDQMVLSFAYDYDNELTLMWLNRFLTTRMAIWRLLLAEFRKFARSWWLTLSWQCERDCKYGSLRFLQFINYRSSQGWEEWSQSILSNFLWSAQVPSKHFQFLNQNSGLIFRNEGPLGFYKGIFPSLLRLPLHSACFFLCYEKIKQFIYHLDYFTE